MHLLLKLLFFFLMKTVSSQRQSGVCSEISLAMGGPLMCCKNYRQVGNSCIECFPGTFGIDCKEDCPHNFYGRLCKERCLCKECDKVYGCPQPGICSEYSQGIQVSCCRNYHFVENKCTECPPGSYGNNCTENCPPPFYGKFCAEKCLCCNQCDKIKGCINKTEECDSEEKSDSVQFHWASISTSLSGSFAVCFTFFLAIACRLRRKRPVTKGCVVSTTHEKNVTASQNLYDYLGKDSYNVLKLKTVDKV